MGFRTPDAHLAATLTTGGIIPSLANWISGATFHTDRHRPALRKVLQDLVASEPDYLVRSVAEDLLGATIPEQNCLAHVHGVNAVWCLTQQTEHLMHPTVNIAA